MAETIETCCTVPKWHWFNIMNDLEQQGGLKGVTINPLSCTDHGIGGETAAGTHFFTSWVHNRFMLLSMDVFEQPLVDAYAAVLEYRPFCRYASKKNGLHTVEWEKDPHDARLAELRANTDVVDLVLLNE